MPAPTRMRRRCARLRRRQLAPQPFQLGFPARRRGGDVSVGRNQGSGGGLEGA